jgi:UDP-N-acetyl-D-mannosaminuronic acid transferase (WecB/TagA/CpsF family)
MTLGPGSWAAQQQQEGTGGATEAAVQAVLSLIQQYTRHSFAPLIKGFTQEATKVGHAVRRVFGPGAGLGVDNLFVGISVPY